MESREFRHTHERMYTHTILYRLDQTAAGRASFMLKSVCWESAVSVDTGNSK